MFTLEVSNNYVKKAFVKKWRDHKSTLKKEYFKTKITLKEKLRNVSLGMLSYQWEDAVRFWNSRIVNELEQAAGKNRNSLTQQGRKVLLV
ncbi:hypothetical protein V6Z11_D13G099100 [Gossypium hirsutum]